MYVKLFNSKTLVSINYSLRTLNALSDIPQFNLPALMVCHYQDRISCSISIYILSFCHSFIQLLFSMRHISFICSIVLIMIYNAQCAAFVAFLNEHFVCVCVGGCVRVWVPTWLCVCEFMLNKAKYICIGKK